MFVCFNVWFFFIENKVLHFFHVLVILFSWLFYLTFKSISTWTISRSQFYLRNVCIVNLYSNIPWATTASVFRSNTWSDYRSFRSVVDDILIKNDKLTARHFSNNSFHFVNITIILSKLWRCFRVYIFSGKLNFETSSHVS